MLTGWDGARLDAFAAQVHNTEPVENAFESAMEGLETTGASEDTRALVELLARHCREEGAMLHHYQRFATEAETPETRYLSRLILDDEIRHHRLLVEMANAIAWGMSKDSPAPAVPDITRRDAGNQALRSETENLLKSEERDRVELKELRKQLRPFKDITLWELIIDLMLLDTDKHIQILRAIAKINDVN